METVVDTMHVVEWLGGVNWPSSIVQRSRPITTEQRLQIQSIPNILQQSEVYSNIERIFPVEWNIHGLVVDDHVDVCEPTRIVVIRLHPMSIP